MRRFLLLVIRSLTWALPRRDRAWGRAAAAEADQIGSLGGLARWAAGAARLLVVAWARVSVPRHARSRAIALVAATATLAAVLAISHQHDGGPDVAGRLPRQAALVTGGSAMHARVGVAHDGVPYGPSIQRLRDLTAAWLRCEYAHGARREPVPGGDGSFRIVSVSADVRASCAARRAAAAAIQLTQAYANDAVATAELTRSALLCVRAQGISLSGPGVALAERGCKRRIELADSIEEPAALP